MDTATVWGLVITFLGTAASFWGAWVSYQQADLSKNSANEAKRAIGQIVNQRHTSDLAELKVHCELAQKSMEQYGPGASKASLQGVNPEKDAEKVRTLLLEANKNSALFQHGESAIFIGKITPLLDVFIQPKELSRIQKNGSAVLMEVSDFLAVVKARHDTRRESTASQA